MPGPKKRLADIAYIPDNSFLVQPNDATVIQGDGIQIPKKAVNKELKVPASKGAKARNAFRSEHPNVSAWNDVGSLIPFAPLIAFGAGASAESATALSAFNSAANYVKGLKTLYSALSKVIPYAEGALATSMGTKGINDLRHGTFTPETLVDLTTLAPAGKQAVAIGNNFRPSRIREHLYVNRVPIGYDKAWETAENVWSDILSGKRANINYPKWLNNENSINNYIEDLSKYSPYYGIERDRALADGLEYLRARIDAWRLYNKLPQKFGTFVKHPHPKVPGSYTAPDAIKKLNKIPYQIPGESQIDFVTSVGGNIGVPSITTLDTRLEDGISKTFGATRTSDWFDLHPFSRGENWLPGAYVNEKVIHPFSKSISKKLRHIGESLAYDEKAINEFLSRPKTDEYDNWFDPRYFPRGGLKGKIGDKLLKLSKKLVGEGYTYPTNIFNKLDDKIKKIEAGKFVGAKPFHVEYDIPWTRTMTFGLDENGNFIDAVPRTQAGFRTFNNMPDDVRDWWRINRDVYGQ